MALVPRIHIDPYGKQNYRNESSKSIFKEQNYYSHVIRAADLNQLTNIFKNDSIIEGLNIISIFLTNNNKTINFTLSPGRIIQDNTLIDILEQFTVAIDIFNEYNILSTNTLENYFEVDGDLVDNFPEDKQFGLSGSVTAVLNHNNWVVKRTQFQDNKTRIYPVQQIIHNDDSGLIINDNFPDSNYGTILIMSKYQFQESLNTQEVEFVPVYVRTNNYFTTVSKGTPGIDLQVYRILYGAIYIEKLDISQVSNNYSFLIDNVSINIGGTQLFVRNGIDRIETLDQGEILIC